MTQLSAREKITSGFSESFRRGIVTLPKIRNPKLEIRSKPEGPKCESQNHAASRRFEPWSLRILNLFRISDFELRICRASNGGWSGVRIPPESRILFLHRPLGQASSLPRRLNRPQTCSPSQRRARRPRQTPVLPSSLLATSGYQRYVNAFHLINSRWVTAAVRRNFQTIKKDCK